MQPASSDLGDDRTGDYRSISGLAVAAAVVGVLSAASLLGPALWIVPLVGVALAVAALREIGRRGSVKVGVVPAVVGLALAVGFGAQAVSQHVAREWIVEWRADAAASEFARAIAEGRLGDARTMCGPTALSAAGDDLEAFAALPAVAMLAGCGGLEQVAVTRSEPPEDVPNGFSRIVQVSCRAADGAARFRKSVRIDVERIEPEAWGSPFDRWRVVRHVPAPVD